MVDDCYVRCYNDHSQCVVYLIGFFLVCILNHMYFNDLTVISQRIRILDSQKMYFFIISICKNIIGSIYCMDFIILKNVYIWLYAVVYFPSIIMWPVISIQAKHLF